MQERIAYEIDGKPYEGMLVYDETVKGPRPAVLMQPDWAGVCPNTIAQAHQIARKDYVVFMADMFGRGYGDKPKTMEDLMKNMRAVRENLPFTIEASNTALALMLAEGGKRGLIDASKTAAVGYCAGGGMALEHARSGADLKAVVTFHVTNPNPLRPGTPCGIKGRVLTVHGAADPVTPRPMIHALEDELTGAGVYWETVMFAGATHSFTDPTAKNPPRNLYDERLMKKSYALMRDFLEESFR
jgi:dienelactone hydrolase